MLADKGQEKDTGKNILDNRLNECKLNPKQRKQLQHEFKVHLEKYFKKTLGKGSDYTKVTIWDNMLIIQGQGFLTQVEKFISSTPKGFDLIRESRMELNEQYMNDNGPFFEEKLEAKCVYQFGDSDPKGDFWIHVMIFDQLLIDI